MHRLVTVSLLITLFALVAVESLDHSCSKANEEFRECASCEATCEERDPICFRMCKPAACQCKPDFFRAANGECVTEDQCDMEDSEDNVAVDDA